jgi:O-antigen ligase
MKKDRSYIHEIILFSGLLISIGSLPFSIVLCHFGILLMLLNWLIEGNWQNKWRLGKGNSFVLLFVALFAFHLIGVLYSLDFKNSLFNVEKKISLLIVPAVLATSRFSNKYKVLLFKSFIASCLIASLLCLGGSTLRVLEGIDSSHLNFGFSQPNLLLSNPLFSNQWHEYSYVTLSSTIGIHPTYFSVYIMLCLALLIVNHKDLFRHKFMSLGLIFFFTIFLALLSTRVTVAVILILMAFAILYRIFKLSRSNMKQFATGAGLILLFFFLSALNPISLYREFQELNSTAMQIDKNTHYTNSTAIRLSLWWLGLKTAMQSHPVIGSGTASTELAMATTANKYNISNVLNSNDPHNQYLNTYISLGAMGLVLLLGCYLTPFRTAWRNKNLTHLIFIGLILIVSFTESFLELQKGIVFFALFQSLFSFNSSQKDVRDKLSLS